MKVIIRYSYYIVIFLFCLSLLLVVFLKEYLSSEIAKSVIDYFFWYTFGLFSGFSAVKRILQYNQRNRCS